MSVTNTQFQRVLYILITLAISAILIWIFIASMAVLIPFLVGILLAYLLMPLINWLESILPLKARWYKAKRIISIIIIFIILGGLIIAFMIYMGTAIISASSVLLNKAPEYITRGIDEATRWMDLFKSNIPRVIEMRIEEALNKFGPSAGKFVQDFVIGSMSVIPSSMPTIIGFLTLPFFLFFVLYDYEKFGKYIHEVLPGRAAQHTENITAIIGNVMGRYIRSQIILGLIVGVMVFLGLLLLQVDYAPALGMVTALTQFIPIIGPVVSGLIIMTITLAVQPEKVIGALIVFFIAQIILNTVFLNWVQGRYMQIHPAVVMVLLVVGGYIAGFWGMILALPVCATAWEVLKYVRSERQGESISKSDQA